MSESENGGQNNVGRIKSILNSLRGKSETPAPNNPPAELPDYSEGAQLRRQEEARASGLGLFSVDSPDRESDAQPQAAGEAKDDDATAKAKEAAALAAARGNLRDAARTTAIDRIVNAEGFVDEQIDAMEAHFKPPQEEFKPPQKGGKGTAAKVVLTTLGAVSVGAPVADSFLAQPVGAETPHSTEIALPGATVKLDVDGNVLNGSPASVESSLKDVVLSNGTRIRFGAEPGSLLDSNAGKVEARSYVVVGGDKYDPLNPETALVQVDSFELGEEVKVGDYDLSLLDKTPNKWRDRARAALRERARRVAGVFHKDAPRTFEGTFVTGQTGQDALVQYVVDETPQNEAENEAQVGSNPSIPSQPSPESAMIQPEQDGATAADTGSPSSEKASSEPVVTDAERDQVREDMKVEEFSYAKAEMPNIETEWVPDPDSKGEPTVTKVNVKFADGSEGIYNPITGVTTDSKGNQILDNGKVQHGLQLYDKHKSDPYVMSLIQNGAAKFVELPDGSTRLVDADGMDVETGQPALNDETQLTELREKLRNSQTETVVSVSVTEKVGYREVTKNPSSFNVNGLLETSEGMGVLNRLIDQAAQPVDGRLRPVNFTLGPGNRIIPGPAGATGEHALWPVVPRENLIVNGEQVKVDAVAVVSQDIRGDEVFGGTQVVFRVGNVKGPLDLEAGLFISEDSFMVHGDGPLKGMLDVFNPRTLKQRLDLSTRKVTYGPKGEMFVVLDFGKKYKDSLKPGQVVQEDCQADLGQTGFIIGETQNVGTEAMKWDEAMAATIVPCVAYRKPLETREDIKDTTFTIPMLKYSPTRKPPLPETGAGSLTGAIGLPGPDGVKGDIMWGLGGLGVGGALIALNREQRRRLGQRGKNPLSDLRK